MQRHIMIEYATGCQHFIMRHFRRFRISTTKRIFYISLLLIGLYALLTLLFKMKAFTVKLPVSNVKWLSYVMKKSPKTHSEFSLNFNNSSLGNRSPRNSSIHMFLNSHTWAFPCENSLQKFLQNPLFPISPNKQMLVDSLDMNGVEQNTKDIKTLGQRIFGFIFAPVTGSYQFSMLTNCDAELWLSKNSNLQNVQLLCKSGDKNKLSNLEEKNLESKNVSEFYSLVVHLNENQFYFMEILLLQLPQNFFHLKWKVPHIRNFQEIPKKYLYSFMGKSLEFQGFITNVPFTLPTQSYINKQPKLSILSSTEKFLSGFQYLQWTDVKLALPPCPYQPGYVGKRVLHQYYAVEKFVNPSYVYPEVKNTKLKDGKWVPWFPLSEEETLDIVGKYLKKLKETYPGKYELKEVLNVEKKIDWRKDNQVFYKGGSRYGNRFFLELLLLDNTMNKQVILSEYIYQHEKDRTLCYPEGMQWNKTASVYLLISVRKQAAWMWHFIKNMERIYQETADENLHVIVYDYDSTDIDIEAAFQQTSFKNYLILKNPDSKYSRTYSLNRAAESVKDPNAIVFTLDLHLEIPPLFPNSVRKHCIIGKMVYTPVITRLSCGSSPRYLQGGWDPWGYGMFGAYKKDWNNFKGFDEVKFKTKWGGEDWDLVNRAYVVGLEFERIKHADFYHYDHSRVGMWT